MDAAIQKAIERKIDDMVSTVGALTSRQQGMEATLLRMSKATGDAQQVLKTALMDGRTQAASVIGFDGCDTLGLLRVTGGIHQKSLGWGSHLVDVANVMNPYAAAFTGFKGDRNEVHKSIGSKGWNLVSKTALAEGSGATGGYTVPVQFYADLLRLVAEDAFIRQLCTVMPMQSKTLYVPALTQSSVPAAGTSAFFGGIAASWQPEAATINESEPNFRQITLTARDLVFYTVASNQLLQDNAVALDTLLTTLFKEGMAWFYDYFILRGNGAAQPLGVVNAPCRYNQTRAGGGGSQTFVIADVANMMSHLLMSSWNKAIWAMHPQVLQKLLIMADSTNGRLVWVNQFALGGKDNAGPIAARMPITLLGLPVYFTEKLPALGGTGDVVLLDMSKYVLGDRMAIQIETSPHVKFLTNQMVWRIITRWDGQPWLDNVITLADGAYQVSPMVVLN